MTLYCHTMVDLFVDFFVLAIQIAELFRSKGEVMSSSCSSIYFIKSVILDILGILRLSIV